LAQGLRTLSGGCTAEVQQPTRGAVGLSAMVKSWTWLNEAAPAIRPTSRTMTTRTPVCVLSLRVAVGVGAVAGAAAGCSPVSRCISRLGLTTEPVK